MPRRTYIGALALALTTASLAAPALPAIASPSPTSSPSSAPTPSTPHPVAPVRSVPRPQVASPFTVSCPGPSQSASSSIDVAPSGFVAIAPQRLVDTRAGATPAPVGARCVLRVELGDLVPAGATAVALTVTSDHAPRPTFVTAYACGGPRPYVSMLNPRPGAPTPNSTVVAIDATTVLCVYADDVTDVIVDVTGWFTPNGDPYHEIPPTRSLDTRTGPRPADLVDKPAAGTTLAVAIGGEVVPAAATAVTATITVTQPDEDGYVTAYPCGASVPATSTDNVTVGQDRAAPAIVGLSSSGTLCLATSIDAHLIVDVTGWFGPDEPSSTAPLVVPASPLDALHPVRLADSRIGLGGWTGRFAAGDERRIRTLDTVALGTTSVELNVTAAEAGTPGYLSVYPCGTIRPVVSAVNFSPGATETAAITVGLGDGGDVCAFASDPTHVIVDLVASNGAGGVPLLRSIGANPPLDRRPDMRQVDLTLHCPVGGGTVRLDAQAIPGATVTIGTSAGATAASVTSTLSGNALIPVRVTGPDGAVEQHWVRCLPDDFPVLPASGRSPTPGWYRASSLVGGTYAFVLDEFGVPVWYQRTPYPVIGLWDVGGGSDLAWRKWTGGGFPVEATPLGYELRSMDGSDVGSVELPGEAVDWHELLRSSNGDLIVVTYPTRTLSGGRTLHCTGVDGHPHDTGVVVDSDIVELNNAGAEVWRWRSRDHIDEGETTLPVCFPLTSTQWGLDLTHVNAVDEAPGGDLIVTARHLDAILRIDRSSGAVEWKLGGTTRTQPDHASLQLIDDPLHGPHAPHDGRILADGHVTVHDNRTDATDDHRPRAAEYVIDAAAKTATLSWSYTSTNPVSSSLGSVRRQPDGDTVIGWGSGVGPWLEEIDPSGRPVLSIPTTPEQIFYRVDKVAASTYDRDALRALAGRSAAPAP